jgi:uncharacterized protein (TIGR00730 family)
MGQIKRIAVYCGSNTGEDHEYSQQAYLLGMMLANRKITIVNGGGKVGLMNVVTNGAVDNGGSVIGILPQFLNTDELAHEKLTEKIIVRSMHERKYKMYTLADAIIALPGGYGTLDELFEMLTWAQLGLHRKPIGLLNTSGFYDHLLTFLFRTKKDGFLKEDHLDMLLIHSIVPELIDLLFAYHAKPNTGKWK